MIRRGQVGDATWRLLRQVTEHPLSFVCRHSPCGTKRFAGNPMWKTDWTRVQNCFVHRWRCRENRPKRAKPLAGNSVEALERALRGSMREARFRRGPRGSVDILTAYIYCPS